MSLLIKKAEAHNEFPPNVLVKVLSCLLYYIKKLGFNQAPTPKRRAAPVALAVAAALVPVSFGSEVVPAWSA